MEPCMAWVSLRLVLMSRCVHIDMLSGLSTTPSLYRSSSENWQARVALSLLPFVMASMPILPFSILLSLLMVACASPLLICALPLMPSRL